MNSLFFGCLLVIASSVIIAEQTSVDINSPLFNQIWQEFISTYAKKYASKKEENNHKETFYTNYQNILAHNALAKKGLSTYKRGINAFTDMTLREVSASRCGFKSNQQQKTSKTSTSTSSAAIRKRVKRLLGFSLFAKTTLAATSKATTTHAPTSTSTTTQAPTSTSTTTQAPTSTSTTTQAPTSTTTTTQAPTSTSTTTHAPTSTTTTTQAPTSTSTTTQAPTSTSTTTQAPTSTSTTTHAPTSTTTTTQAPTSTSTTTHAPTSTTTTTQAPTSTSTTTHAPTSTTTTTFLTTSVSSSSSFNWVADGYVTAVKDQGECGACWAFSATGAMEGQHFANTGQLVSLSEENLVDCSTQNNGCNGGNMDLAFAYVIQNGGIDTEKSYPYTAGNGTSGTCHFNSTNVGATFKNCTDLPSGNETALMQAVTSIGPISVAIDGSQEEFMSYSSGIYNNPNCTDNLDHAVLVVGYGVQNGTDYWIVKNSWGTSWGMAGYIWMSRNNGNQCGIASAASYPIPTQ